MESKEVDLRSKALMKATAEKQPSSTILKLLDELRTGVQATEELLRATRVGVNVGRLRQHPDPAIAKQASELVSKWRMDVRKTAGGASTPKSTNGTASPAPGQTPSATPKPKAKHSVPGDKRNTQTDHVDCQVTDSKTRNNCIKLMYDGLAFMSDEREYLRLRWKM
jgi:transcription elongation factor S-II